MLSFSTKGSAKHDNVTKVQEATRIAHEMAPDLALDGELTLLVAKGDEQSVQLSPNLPESLAAPVDAGAPAGTVDVIVDGKTVASIPVVTMEAVAGRGIRPALQRFWQNWTADF